MRYLVVGHGNIGAKRQRVLRDRCVAIVDPYTPRADYRALADCPLDAYDAAVLCVPNQVKLELLEFLLDRGKHALVEKPLLFPDPEAADALYQKATRRAAIWYTSYNFRFEPHVVALKRLMAEGTIGEVYRASMFYGYGTAARAAGTWRDSALGVLEDLATHLIDLSGFLFGRVGSEFVVWERRNYEMNGIDHCILATADRKIVIECSLLSWKNRWSIDVVGARGALRMDGLTKWGKSELVIQRRRFPCGVPEEHREVVAGPDPTWAADVCHFEAMVARGETSYCNDRWLSEILRRVATAPLH